MGPSDAATTGGDAAAEVVPTVQAPPPGRAALPEQKAPQPGQVSPHEAYGGVPETGPPLASAIGKVASGGWDALKEKVGGIWDDVTAPRTFGYYDPDNPATARNKPLPDASQYAPVVDHNDPYADMRTKSVIQAATEIILKQTGYLPNQQQMLDYVAQYRPDMYHHVATALGVK
jgi:hypothetical protein